MCNFLIGLCNTENFFECASKQNVLELATLWYVAEFPNWIIDSGSQ